MNRKNPLKCPRKKHDMQVSEDGYKRCVKCGTLTLRGVPAHVRFWEHVNKAAPVSTKRPDLGNCWEWEGFKDKDGYGQFNVMSQHRIDKAHRYAWQLIYGEIPVGMQLDHLCVNPPCIRPSHLEVVTIKENARRRRKAFCSRGHAQTEDNRYYPPGGAGHGRCLTCSRYWKSLRSGS